MSSTGEVDRLYHPAGISFEPCNVTRILSKKEMLETKRCAIMNLPGPLHSMPHRYFEKERYFVYEEVEFLAQRLIDRIPWHHIVLHWNTARHSKRHSAVLVHRTNGGLRNCIGRNRIYPIMRRVRYENCKLRHIGAACNRTALCSICTATKSISQRGSFLEVASFRFQRYPPLTLHKEENMWYTEYATCSTPRQI